MMMIRLVLAFLFLHCAACGDGPDAESALGHPVGAAGTTDPTTEQGSPVLKPPAETPQDELPWMLSPNPVYIAHYTILARDPETGDLGLARVTNCPGSFGFTVAGDAKGLAATGGRGETIWAKEAVARLRRGESPEQILQAFEGEDRQKRIRQLAILPAEGKSLVFSGDGVLSTAESIVEEDLVIFTAVTPPMPVAMSMQRAYRGAMSLPLAERLFAALDAGAAHVEPGGRSPGGLARSTQAVAAHLLIVRKDGGFDGASDTLLDLRVEYDRDPLARLKTVYQAYGMLVLGPRLLQLQRTIADTGSKRYQANRHWIERLRARSEIGR